MFQIGYDPKYNNKTLIKSWLCNNTPDLHFTTRSGINNSNVWVSNKSVPLSNHWNTHTIPYHTVLILYYSVLYCTMLYYDIYIWFWYDSEAFAKRLQEEENRAVAEAIQAQQTVNQQPPAPHHQQHRASPPPDKQHHQGASAGQRSAEQPVAGDNRGDYPADKGMDKERSRKRSGSVSLDWYHVILSSGS